MSVKKDRTASYQRIADASGIRFRFLCDLSELAVYTSQPLQRGTDEELMRIWQTEGRANFNQCHLCGRWVCDAMYNADVLACVACVPWEDLPSYCPHCGEKLPPGDLFCRRCGVRLRYGEVRMDDA